MKRIVQIKPDFLKHLDLLVLCIAFLSGRIFSIFSEIASKLVMIECSDGFDAEEEWEGVGMKCSCRMGVRATFPKPIDGLQDQES